MRPMARVRVTAYPGLNLMSSSCRWQHPAASNNLMHRGNPNLAPSTSANGSQANRSLDDAYRQITRAPRRAPPPQRILDKRPSHGTLGHAAARTKHRAPDGAKERIGAPGFLPVPVQPPTPSTFRARTTEKPQSSIRNRDPLESSERLGVHPPTRSQSAPLRGFFQHMTRNRYNAINLMSAPRTALTRLPLRRGIRGMFLKNSGYCEWGPEG